MFENTMLKNVRCGPVLKHYFYIWFWLGEFQKEKKNKQEQFL